MRDHADRGSNLAEISLWNFSQMISPWNVRQAIKLCIGHIIGRFIVDIDQHFSIKFFPTIVYCLFRSLSSPTITCLACEIIHLAYISVGHPYHATGPYIVQILKRGIFKFCILDRIDEYHKRVCNILFLENRFNKYFFPLIKLYNEYFEIKRNWISRSRVIDLQGKIIRYFIQSYEISWQNVRRGIPRDVISNIGMAQVFPPCVQSPRWGWGACIIRVFEW